MTYDHDMAVCAVCDAKITRANLFGVGGNGDVYCGAGLKEPYLTKLEAYTLAAAPELLDALMDAAKRLMGAGMCGGEDDPVWKALKKATGEKVEIT